MRACSPRSSSRSPRHRAWPAGCCGRRARSRSVFVICAVFAPWLAPYGFAQSATPTAWSSRSSATPARRTTGSAPTDLFFDILSRVIWGARTALEVVVLSVLFSVAARRAARAWCPGFFGGWLDRVLVLIMDALYAFPSFLLAIVFSFLLSDMLGGGVDRGGAVADGGLHPAVLPGGPQHDASARRRRRTSRPPAPSGRATVTIMRKYLFGNVIQRVPVHRHAERRRRHRHPGRASASSGSASSRPRRPSGATTCSRALDDAAGRRLVDRRCTRAWPSSLLITGADPGRRGPQRDRSTRRCDAAGCCRSSCRRATPTDGRGGGGLT